MDQAFYDQLVHGTLQGPRHPQLRLASPFRVFLNTHTDDGTPIGDDNLASAQQAIEDVTPLLTGGQRIALVDRGWGTVYNSGWVTIRWEPMSLTRNHTCASTEQSVSPRITLRQNPACFCGGMYNPAAIKHEMGHALGFGHTDSPGDLMFWEVTTCDKQPSAREQLHGAIAYRTGAGVK